MKNVEQRSNCYGLFSFSYEGCLTEFWVEIELAVFEQSIESSPERSLDELPTYLQTRAFRCSAMLSDP